VTWPTARGRMPATAEMDPRLRTAVDAPPPLHADTVAVEPGVRAEQVSR